MMAESHVRDMDLAAVAGGASQISSRNWFPCGGVTLDMTVRSRIIRLVPVLSAAADGMIVRRCDKATRGSTTMAKLIMSEGFGGPGVSPWKDTVREFVMPRT